MVSNSISRGVMESPSGGDRHYIASQGDTSLAGAVMREVQMLCVKLPPSVAGSGGDFFGNHPFAGNLAFGNLST